MLLNDATQNGGARLPARRIERNDHAALVYFSDRNPRGVSNAHNAADPAHLTERLAIFQIDEQVWTKPPRVLRRSTLFGNPRHSLAADQRNLRRIVGSPVIPQQEQTPPRALLKRLAQLTAIDCPLLSARHDDRHHYSLNRSLVGDQLRQLAAVSHGKPLREADWTKA